MKIDVSDHGDFYHLSINPFTDEIQTWIETQFDMNAWWIAGGHDHGETWLCMKHHKDVTLLLLRWL